jgi:hypothetical protein
MDLIKTGWGAMDWIHLIQNRNKQSTLVSMVINLQVSNDVGNSMSSCATGMLKKGAP